MKTFIIQQNDSGQRLDKYLKKILPKASSGFLYKMLRKKNITLNGKKAEGKELLTSGDNIRLFFSEETFAKFSKDAEALQEEYEALKALPMKGLSVIYEDADVIALNKPYNMLSQKAAPTDLSANEYLIGYLIRQGVYTLEDMNSFRPSICNRLDRNTTGILLAGKTLQGLQKLSEALKSRAAGKYYRALVAGKVSEPAHLKGYLKKEESANQVQIYEKQAEGSLWIETAYEPVEVQEDHTMLEIHLITGRSHQIRAHLASIGHPIIGDLKYGSPKINKYYRKEYGITHQLLHAYRVEFPGQEAIIAPLPEEFNLRYK